MPLHFDNIYDFIVDLIHFEGRGPLDATTIEFRRRGFTLRRLRSIYHELLSLVEVQKSSGSINDRLAWKLLSAYVSIDKEGVSLSMDLSVARERAVQNVRIENDIDLDAAVRRARKVENRVVECIRKICEMCVYGEQFDFNSNFLFEYFCDKNILMLLVEMFAFESSSKGENQFAYVTCSSLVKSQILQSLSMMINNVHNPTSIYYLLSNNYLNTLIQSFHPLNRFTSSALDEMVPMYVTLLKNLALKLRDHPHLIEFLSIPSSESVSVGESAEYIFPLFSAAVSIAMSKYARTDSFGHITALSIVVNLCQTSSDLVVGMIEDDVLSQQSLFDHLCREVLSWCSRAQIDIINYDKNRNLCQKLEGNLMDLQDKLQFLNDLLMCGIKQLNVRLCEHILRRVIYGYIIPQLCNSRDQLVASQSIAISLHTAKMHVSVMFLTQIFAVVQYKPLLKMVVVSALHGLTPDLNQCHTGSNEFDLTSQLHEIVKSNHQNDSKNEAKHFKENQCRLIILDIISCNLGEVLFISVSNLMCCVLQNELIDIEFLQQVMKLLPLKESNGDGLDIEVSLSLHFKRNDNSLDSCSQKYVEFLTLTYLSKVSHLFWDDPDKFCFWWKTSPLVSSLVSSRSFYTSRLKELRDDSQISLIFLDLFQTETYEYYRKDDNQDICSNRSLSKTTLPFVDCSYFTRKKQCDMVLTDIDKARFYISMLLFFRSICERIMSLRANIEARLYRNESKVWSTLTDEAINDDIESIGALGSYPQKGQDLNLSGRTCFLCYIQQAENGIEENNNCSADCVITPQTYLILVIDPSVIFAVLPYEESESGNILFVSPMSHILTTVADGIWLYIAKRPISSRLAILSGDGSFKGKIKRCIEEYKAYFHKANNVFV